ncbi:xanthine dehydrogenase family protein molybdopterin-binding subunit [Pseudoduganella albidiflava]|uniref:Aldehyde dehydrogenase n=1 Tax=Pseudoduganella albidiflava TaxID=321983 RepID=A0A411WSI5_9BURK|nr:molybdopterin cofactor-binding domain-containing protein [Pseudoduganella albidiflava]QBH99568.1 xanthine dehydrogenase family protein molybdopterin-binding subunit [Pseudoduganella albidiflava]GGY45851.1 aldehyde dehydrogenase [Pseudoduganella albidiflava]
MMKRSAGMTRRNAVKLMALAGGGLLLEGFLPAARGKTNGASAGAHVGYFLRIPPEGPMEFALTQHEMGQGVGTSLAMIFAQELGVPMAALRVVPVAETGGRYVLSGTGGSNSVKDSWLPLRRGAALARQALVAAAARRWQCDSAACTVQAGHVVGPLPAQRLSFGALAAEAAADAPPDREAFRKLAPPLREAPAPGGSQPNVFAEAIVRGEQPYGIDTAIPGMLHASVERSPRLGGKVRSFDATRALRVPGVRAVVLIEGHVAPARNVVPPAPYYSSKDGVAVIATSTWAALQGRRALTVEWETPAGPAYDNTAWEAHAAKLLDDAVVLGEQGSAAGGGTEVAAEYVYPFQAHACMEPMNCVAHHTSSRIDVWVGAQSPNGWRDGLAELFKLPQKDVVLHPRFSGGGFGRRFYMDTAIEAVRISAAAGHVPVKVTWTREDDLRHDHFHPYAHSRLRARLNADGTLAAWHHDEARAYFASARGEIPWFGYDAGHVRYAFANAQSGSPLQGGAWRSVVANHWAFAQECFIDELAHAAARDPVRFRLALLASGADKPAGDRYKVSQARLRKVVERAAELAGWGGAPSAAAGTGTRTTADTTTGRGFAVYPYLHGDSYCAMVIDVAVRGRQFRITRVVAVVDCGLVINADGARQQVEGGIAWGLSAALHGGIRLAEGAVANTNFHDTPVLRHADMPRRIEVHFVQEPGAAPCGLGEIAPPLVAPALCNALFAATGQRIRRLPVALA